MSRTETRPYRQTRRAESSEATRQRIIAAARDQLLSGEDFTVEAVAARARVSRMTVYAQIGGRDSLREAVFDHLAATGGLDDIPQVFGARHPAAALDRLVEIFCGFYATHRPVLRRLNALAALAAGTAGRLPDRNQRRRQILGALLARAAELPDYQGVDVEASAAMLQALTSFEFYDQLAGEMSETEITRHIQRLAGTLLRAP